MNTPITKDQLPHILDDLKKKMYWIDYDYIELPDGRICFKIQRPSDNNSEIYFDNYTRFITDFVSHLIAK